MASAVARAYNGGRPPEADEVFVFKALIFQCICYTFAWNDVFF